jgi:hypothetical protein
MSEPEQADHHLHRLQHRQQQHRHHPNQHHHDQRKQNLHQNLEHSHGITVTNTIGVKFGLPTVFEGDVSISTAISNDFKWGKTTSDTQAFSFTVPATALKYSEVTATATANRSEIELPFTITWKSKKSGYEIKSKGIYKGTTYWKGRTEIGQKPLDGESRSAEDGEVEEVDVEPEIEIISGGGAEERSLEGNGEGGDEYGKLTYGLRGWDVS